MNYHRDTENTEKNMVIISMRLCVSVVIVKVSLVLNCAVRSSSHLVVRRR